MFGVEVKDADGAWIPASRHTLLVDAERQVEIFGGAQKARVVEVPE